MKSCTFFGHADAPDSLAPVLRSAVTELIARQGVDVFYVGTHGRFDAMAAAALQALSLCYPITFSVVLAYLPKPGDTAPYPQHTLLPDGIETVPRRFAISYRNRWMLDRSEFAVIYVTHTWGGAAQFKALAEKRGKTVVELAAFVASSVVPDT